MSTENNDLLKDDSWKAKKYELVYPLPTNEVKVGDICSGSYWWNSHGLNPLTSRVLREQN